MAERRSLKIWSIVLLFALLPGLAMARMPEHLESAVQNSESGIALDLTLPPYEISQDEDGSHVIRLPEFEFAGEPGEPLLPYTVYDVALPPDVSPETLSVDVVGGKITKLPGIYDLKLALPDMTSAGFADDSFAESRFLTTASGINPSDFVRLLPPGQLRKWRFARLLFSPFYYDAGTGELTVADSLSVRITYSADRALSSQDTVLLADNVMDDVAAQLLVNYDEALSWYGSTDMQGQDSPSITYDYVIITTNAIEAGSSILDDFVAYKELRGHSVALITEDEYGSLTGQSPNGTAEKIRQWLVNNYTAYGIEYVLLIGNPDPSSGDVPMKMCWPRKDASDSYKEAPTDTFYADLTGNWDLDGDSYFGEWSDYAGTGGVDFANEVYVGRIPVYSGAYSTLDSILQKTIAYESELAAAAAWRENALLPMSFSTSLYDGAPLAEQMMDDYLDYLGYGSWTQYQQGSGACFLDSAYASDEELHGSTVVRDRWSANDFGLVVWWGHGSQTGAYIGCDSCWDGTLFSNSYTTYLDDTHPSFVFQNSCLNGYPEYSTNLQYALLKQGSIGAVGASRVSWFNTGVGYGGFDGSTTNSGMAYEYAKRLTLYDQPAGNALANTRISLNPSSSTRLMNFYDFNLYGDPSTGISSTAILGSISGTVRDTSGQGIADVAVGFDDARPGTITNSSGYYSQIGFDSGTYTVTFSLDGYTFSPKETKTTVSGSNVTLDSTGYREQTHSPEFGDDFDSGDLDSPWAVETDYEGRASVDSTYPYSGTYCLLLDDDTGNSTYSHASVILPLDLRFCTEAQLSFWWRSFGSETHPDDGVFISDDDGQTWTKIHDFTGNSPAYSRVALDLLEATSLSAMSSDHHFQVKFQFYGNSSVGTDGYAIDEVLTVVTQDVQKVYLPFLKK